MGFLICRRNDIRLVLGQLVDIKAERKSELEALKEENRRLKKALELEKIRAHGYKLMIEITEREEGISILNREGNGKASDEG